MKALNYEQINNTFDLNYTLLESYIKLNERKDNHDYSKDYYTITALESGDFSIVFNPLEESNTLLYSLDSGETWESITSGNPETLSLNENDTILLKGINSGLVSGKSKCVGLSTSTRYELSGNILSLIYGDEFDDKNTGINLPTFYDGQSSLVSAKNLVLPSVLSGEGYIHMFSGCTSLTIAPKLPATTLSESCYAYMFSGCTSLTTAPELPALGLVANCYQSMFNGCTSLNYIKAMFTTTPSNNYTLGWVTDVAAQGTFVKNASASWDVTGSNGIPEGWTVETASE